MEMEVYTHLDKISTCINIEIYRNHVSLNSNHRKSHQKMPHSYLSCRHQVGQWLSDHDALQSVTGELLGEWYQLESQGQETHLKIQ